MDLAPDESPARSNQLMPTPFSQGGSATSASWRRRAGGTGYRSTGCRTITSRSGAMRMARIRPRHASCRKVWRRCRRVFMCLPYTKRSGALWQGYPARLRRSLAPWSGSQPRARRGYAVTVMPSSTLAWRGWPLGVEDGGRGPSTATAWSASGRNLSPDTGSGAELYTVIGHAPRHADRNIALVGRVIEIEHLSACRAARGRWGSTKRRRSARRSVPSGVS